MKNKIIGIYIGTEVNETYKVQEILTNYGNIIKTRLGLNHLENDETGLRGMIILELSGDENQIQKFQDELLAIKSLKLGKMVF